MKDQLDREIEAALGGRVPEKKLARVYRTDGGKVSEAGRERALIAYRVVSVIVTAVIILILLWSVADLPTFGGAENPADNEVAGRYLEKGLEEGGAANLVANMILDYRAFDTLGESNVLFTACCAVMMLMSFVKSDARKIQVKNDAGEDVVLQYGARALCPVILLYALYIMLNGHLGPGGGFSGGAVMGAAMILYRNAFGAEKIRQYFTLKMFRWISFAALAFYALSKAYSFYTGANGLESFISNGTPGAILSAGLILPLNIAVGFVVGCTMYGFYALFERGEI